MQAGQVSIDGTSRVERTEPPSHVTVPLIRRLTIERFRGIKLVWHPASGVNVILGGGDVGKTTILEAIALLLHPTNTALLSDADYWRRGVQDGFCIEAVMSLPESCGINQQTKQVWPWAWDGTAPVLPKIDEDPEAGCVCEPVYCLRVRGTPEFDAFFEILQPDGSADHLTVAVRRSIGLVRLGGDDRNDRDLRLVQGSALDRLLSDKTLRARLGQDLAGTDIEGKLKEEAKKNLHDLETAFQEQDLPTGLGLGLTGGQGFSLNALFGLTATKDEVTLPLTSWGAGTRRLAALEIAAAHQGEHPVAVVDEIERGLEPYRQRVLMAKLQETGSQVFVTTHSAAALSAASKATLWHIDHNGAIGRLKENVSSLRTKDPETFLARVAIIAEGKTEYGFVEKLLQRALDQPRLDLGIWIADADGNKNALSMLEGLVDSGLAFAGFVDNEGCDLSKWAALSSRLDKLLFRWATGCLEENIIGLIPDERLEEFITDPEGNSGDRLRTLADRLEVAEKDFATIKAKAPDLRRLIIEAATGRVPDSRQGADSGEKKTLKKHGQRWFKSIEGGQELAVKVFTFGLWPQLEPQLLPFLNAIRKAIELPEITTLLR